MRLKNYLLIGSAFLATSLFMACGDDEVISNEDPVNPDTDDDDDDNAQVDESTIIWPADTVVTLTEHYTVPEGKSLIIKEGAQIIVSTQGVGANHIPVEFTVDGNLYCEGTAEKPIRFSIAEEDRKAENIFQEDYMWGGIVATETCQEMLINHTIIEYTGAQVIEGSPAATAGIYTAGDDAYPQITTYNMNGKYVITNSVLRNGWSDGIYMMGGQVDVAGNVMYSPNTNGLKLSSSGQSENRGQAKVQAYNNTIINAGWRRDGEKGGCIYVEKNVLANVFNNLMVNCKFRAMTPSFSIPNNPEEGYDDSSVIDYNFYASGSQKSEITFPDESGVAYAWEGYNYEHEDYNVGVVDLNSVIATKDDLKDPMFVNYDVNGVSLTNYIYDENWDFSVKAGSPVLSGAYSGSDANMQPYFGANGLTVNGETYVSPAIQPWFGAYGE